MPFRFVHTADIHLDSPLRSLSLRNPDLANLIGDATRQALVAIVDLCLEEQVDALVIAGDLYDGDQTSMKTARFLAGQMARLDQAGIAVFKIRGNHDALSKITHELVLPPSVKVFGARADVVELQRPGLTLAFHGLSFAKPHAPESLLGKYRAPVADAVNIGLMHTSLDGAPGHDPYAPCTATDLHLSGFDYWALGHIHQRSQPAGARTVVMPGMPQGRDINEAGAKTVTLVTIHDDRTVSTEERLTSVAEFARVTVDISAAQDWRAMVAIVTAAMENARSAALSPHLVARIRITGQTGLNFAIRRDLDLLRTELESRGEGIGLTWVEKLELQVQPPGTGTTGNADPVTELGALMRGEILQSEPFREDVREMVRELLDDLPAECRHFAGNTDEEFESFLESLMRESGEDMIARLKSPGREEA